MEKIDKEVFTYAMMDGVCFLFVNGNANFLVSKILKQFMQRWEEDEKGTLLIELHSCRFMDSTFMGTMVGCYKNIRNDPERVIKLVNPNSTVLEAIKSLGLNRFIEVIDLDVPGGIEKKKIFVREEHAGSPTAEFVLGAHQELADLSPENREKFEILIRSLRKKVSE